MSSLETSLPSAMESPYTGSADFPSACLLRLQFFLGKWPPSLLREEWVRNYLDDIILWSQIFPTMQKRLERVFICLMEGGVKLNLSKCTFWEAEMQR